MILASFSTVLKAIAETSNGSKERENNAIDRHHSAERASASVAIADDDDWRAHRA